MNTSSYRAHYTLEMAQAAVRTYVRRRLFAEQKGLWLATVGLIAFFLWLLWSGDRSWLIGIVAAVAASPFILVAAGWRAHYANTVGRFVRMKEPSAQISYDDDGLTFASDLGHGQMPWSRLTEVWQHPGFWMVFVGKSQFNILPDAGMPEGLRERLREKTKERDV